MDLNPAQKWLPEMITESDLSLIEMWLKGKSLATVKNYLFEIRGFFEWFDSYSRAAGLDQLGLECLTTEIFGLYIHEILMYRSKSKRARARAALGSLFQFLARTGMIQKNPFDLIPSIKTKSKVFDRYLSCEQVLKMIALESHSRNRLILKCLYQGAFRVSELVGIRWIDLSYAQRDQMMFVAVIGKGSKPRTVGLCQRDIEQVCWFKACKVQYRYSVITRVNIVALSGICYGIPADVESSVFIGAQLRS